MEKLLSCRGTLISFPEDSSNWLPESIRSEITANNDPSQWRNAAETLSFLNIITAIKQSRLDVALNLIEDLAESTIYPAALCILRARVHFWSCEYDETIICLDAASKFGGEDTLLKDALSEFNPLLRELKSQDLMLDHNRSNRDPEDREESSWPTFANTIFIIQPSNKLHLKRLLTSFERYAPRARLFISVPDFDFIGLSESSRFSYGINDGKTLGSSLNSCVAQISYSYHQYIAFIDENIVLDPNTIELIFADYLRLIKEDKKNLGWLVARKNCSTAVNSEGTTSICDRPCNAGLPQPFSYTHLPLVSSTIRIIDHRNWINAPPIQQLSTEIQFLDMEAIGFKHFISQAQCRCVQSLKLDTSQNEITEVESKWIRDNRGHYIDILGVND